MRALTSAAPAAPEVDLRRFPSSCNLTGLHDIWAKPTRAGLRNNAVHYDELADQAALKGKSPPNGE